MLTGIRSLITVRLEDRRKLWIMGTVFFLAGVAEMVNYTSFMAIFNSRIGTQYLPIMYLIEAFLLPIEGWLLSLLAQRMSKPKFMIAMYVLFVGLGLLNGLILLVFMWTTVSWFSFYIFLFLSSNFVIRQQTLLMWSTAFDLCPTQQAKRLIPLFVTFAILGGVVAGIISNTLAPVLGADMLYILAAIFLLLGLPNFLSALKQYLIPLTFNESQSIDDTPADTAAVSYTREIFKSPFLLAVIGIMTLMPASYFLIEYQYFTSAQAVFTTEAELTSFYGLMVMILFIAALLFQLFAAKLIEWLGASNTILAISALFLGSFGIISFFIDSHLALIGVSIGYGLTYLLLYYFAEPSYQFYFKMLPLEHRDGFRYTAQGIAASAGILLGSAVSMLHSEVGLSLSFQAFVGVGMTLFLLLIAWLGRHLYIKELVRYLKISSSQAKDFLNEILESMGNDRVRQTLIQQLRHPDVTVQSLTLELFRSNPDPAVTEPLFQYTIRAKDRLRAQGLMAIHLNGWTTLSPDQRETLMQDKDEHVRAIVFRKLLAAFESAVNKQEWIERAIADTSVLVQAEALRVMDQADKLDQHLRGLLEAGGEAAILACDIIGERRLKAFFYDVMMTTLSPSPVVKIAAVRSIGRMGGQEAATSLTEMLIGADLELRSAIEAALIDIGSDALQELSRFITSLNDEIWRTTVTVVNKIGSEKDIQELIVPSCIQKLNELQANHDVVKSIEKMGHKEWTDLASMRSDELTQSLLDTIWAVMVRFGDERSIPHIRQAVESSNEELRDHGLEILSEGLGNAKLAGALYAFYQKHQLTSRKSMDPSQNIMVEEAKVADPWLQAIAIKAGAVKGESALVDNWDYLSALDKIVFLKQVPLFEEIPIEELGKVASIANEKVYDEGEFLVKQGELSVSLIVIVDGHIELSGVNANGTEGTIGILGPKQSIGEASLFDERPSIVSAQVLFDRAKVLEISGSETIKLVRLYPEIGIGLLRSVGHQLRSMEHLVLKLG